MLKEVYHENFETLHVGTMPNRAYYIPYSNKADAKDSELRAFSTRMTLLNGDWNFSWFKSIYDIDKNWFYCDIDREKMALIPVPSTWQTQGYDYHQYVNIQYPFPFDPPYVPHDNPCSVYVRDFELTDENSEFSQFLNFEGVDSCYYVWVNGSFVGYSQVSHQTSEFDITSFTKIGTNQLKVLVFKWCDGSYLEDQDKFRMSGIFRDVYILYRPQNHIRDYKITTQLNSDFTNAVLNVDFEFLSENAEIEYELHSPDGNLTSSGTVIDSRLRVEINSPSLWNAEQPLLYTLLISCGGEFICEKVGFRKIYIENSVIKLNGHNIKFRGVNRHDSHPLRGPAVTIDDIINDMKIMKLHNINAIRTSHYPNAPYFAELCDQYGFYVCSEADLETHGVTSLAGSGSNFSLISGDERFITSWVDRSEMMYHRDKNRPSILMWSVGNEAGFGICAEKSLEFLKNSDPHRLTHYEGDSVFPENHEPNYTNLDTFSRMYHAITEIEQLMTEYKSGERKKPFLLCEYCHAMGNGPGDLEDYHQLILNNDNFAGGFIWEWCDHAMYRGESNSDNGTRGGAIYGYGGDFDEFPHDGEFCVDGLVYPDRRPHTGLIEYKNVIRPLRISKVDNTTFEAWNLLDFTLVGDYLDVYYEITLEGEIVKTAKVESADLFKLAPHSKCQFEVDTGEISGNKHIRFIYYSKNETDFVPKCHLLGFDQIELNAKLPVIITSSAPSPKYSESKKYIVVENEKFRYIYNKLTGVFESLVANNRPIIEKPMEYNIWRAPTDNDRYIKDDWQYSGYDKIVSRTYSNSVKKDENQIIISSILSISAVSRQRFLDITATWSIDGDGKITAKIEVDKNPLIPFLPRFGVRMFLPDSMQIVEYFGYGPYESYIDKRRASWMGKFVDTTPKMHEPYIRPQENGSHYNCNFINISGLNGELHVNALTKPLSFNASQYTSEMLFECKHDFELKKSGYTVFCLDYVQSGIGSNSCGPELLDKYRLNDEHFIFEFSLEIN